LDVLGYYNSEMEMQIEAVDVPYTPEEETVSPHLHNRKMTDEN
jgi:hypothetical protein